MDYRFGHYPAGEFIGVLAALLPDMTDSAAVEAAAMFAPPPAAASAAPPSTSGDPSGGHVTLTGWTDLLKIPTDCFQMLRNSSKIESAKQACEQELDECDKLKDPTGLDQYNCKQDFATKYGAPASIGAAKGRCACQKSGACANGLTNAGGCSWF